MGVLIGLPPGGLEQDGGGHSPVNVLESALCISIQGASMAVRSNDVSINRILQSVLTKLSEDGGPEPGNSSGAEPSVISGS